MNVLNPLFEVGTAIVFMYPESNYRGVKRRMKLRRVFVQRVIDVGSLRVHDPRPHIEVEDPLLKRSRYLVCGIDLDTGNYRQFYDGSMEDVEPCVIEASSIVMERSFQTGFAVAVVDCHLDRPPEMAELPDMVRFTDVMVCGVAQDFAAMIADAVNRDAFAAGRRDRWAVVIPPGFAYPNADMARAAFSRSASA